MRRHRRCFPWINFRRTLAACTPPTISTCSPWAWFPGQEEQAETADQDEPRINPLHDMDSLEFLLWVEQEAEREMARRKGQAAEPAPEQFPEKTGTV